MACLCHFCVLLWSGISSEFKTFTTNFGIKHIFIAVYKTSTNDLLLMDGRTTFEMLLNFEVSYSLFYSIRTEETQTLIFYMVYIKIENFRLVFIIPCQ